MTAHYDIHLRVPVAKLATILEVLNGEGKLLSVTEAEAPKSTRAPVTRTRPEEKGVDFALRLLKIQNLSASELARAFDRDGRASNSASPVISGLVKQGRVRKLDNGKYQITPGV